MELSLSYSYCAPIVPSELDFCCKPGTTIMADYDRGHRRTRILCVNCNICVNTLRRYEVLALDARVAGLLCSWVCPRFVLQGDVVCEACRDLAMFAVNKNLQQDVSGNTDQQPGSSHQGHTNVCLLCGLSTLRRRSDKILRSNPSQLQQSMIAIIESRVAPREISQHDVVCHTCWLRVQREACRMSTVDATRSQLSASPPQEEPQVLEEVQVSQSEPATHSIDEVTLPDYRRAANTNHHCVFPNCVDTDVFDDDKNGAEDDSDTIVESNVCRVCLALDVKMYDLKDIALREMFQNITGISVTENNHSILDCLCWECAGRLKTAADFRNKALLSDTLLQGLANTSEQVRKNDITLLKDNKGYLKLAANLSTVETFHTVNIDAVDLNVPTVAKNNDMERVLNIDKNDLTQPKESVGKEHTDVMGFSHELIVESLIKTEIESDPVNINGDDELMTEAQIKTEKEYEPENIYVEDESMNDAPIKTETDFDSIDPNTGENRIIVSETNSFVSNTSNIEDTNNSAVTSPLPGCSNSELQCLLKTPDDCGDEIKKTPTKVKNSDSISKVVSKKSKIVDHDHKYVKGDAKIKNVNTTVGGIRKETINRKLVKKTRNKANTSTYHEW